MHDIHYGDSMFVSFNSQMNRAIGGTGTTHSSGAPEFTRVHPALSRVRVAQSLVFNVVFCRSFLSFFFGS